LIYVENKVARVVMEAAAQAVAADRHRLRALERENTELRAAIGELKGEVVDFRRRFELDLATRGHNDGHELPAPLVQPKPRAAARRKRPRATGSTGRDGVLIRAVCAKPLREALMSQVS
jgi:hypothetical protein